MTDRSKQIGNKADQVTPDDLFADPLSVVNKFKFDHKVASVFPDMISRSVPGYSTILHMIGQLSAQYAQDGSNCYDLGCSLGAATLAMRHGVEGKKINIIAVDNSEAMLERCKSAIDQDSASSPVNLTLDDIQSVAIENASVCVLNFTLQFVAPNQRFDALSKIYHGMTSGGILILSEKLKFNDPHHDSLMIKLHHDFKRANGYSELEIAQKRDAIENVLIPESYQTHVERLQKIGFTGVELWFQCFNFCSIIAFK